MGKQRRRKALTIALSNILQRNSAVQCRNTVYSQHRNPDTANSVLPKNLQRWRADTIRPYVWCVQRWRACAAPYRPFSRYVGTFKAAYPGWGFFRGIFCTSIRFFPTSWVTALPWFTCWIMPFSE